MFQSLFFENDLFAVHPLGAQEIKRYQELAEDVFLILGDQQNLKYVPGKQLSDLNEAEDFIKSVILNYHVGRNFLHFVTDKKSGRAVGLIDLISPETAREFYDFSSYPYFIEFYLSSAITGCSVMTSLLPDIVEQVKNQGISTLGAVVHRENIAAQKVLMRSRFSFQRSFDLVQDYYQLG